MQRTEAKVEEGPRRLRFRIVLSPIRFACGRPGIRSSTGICTKMDDVTKMDIYAFLGVEETASDSEVKKAFRVKALTCHPDKNPDDPKAAEQFHRYSRAAEVLLDSAARQAYDRLYRARKERQARNQTLDGARKKFKDQLEARERASRDEKGDDMDQALQLAQQIERLRREGSKQLEQENEELRQQIRREGTAGPAAAATTTAEPAEVRVKVSWKGAAGPVDPNRVKSLFQRFGPIQDFIVASKSSSALIVYEDSESIVKATTSALTSGFTIDVLSPFTVTKNKTFPSLQKRSENYEQVVLEKLRQKAEEQKNAAMRNAT